MRRLLIGLLAGACVLLPLAVAVPAHGDTGATPHCVTRAEWSRVGLGMTRWRVHQITGIPGRNEATSLYGDGAKDVDVSYRQCLRSGRPAPNRFVHAVWITYHGDQVRPTIRARLKDHWRRVQ